MTSSRIYIYIGERMNKNRIQTQIDFRQGRGSTTAKLIYTALMHYNGVGKSKTTASKIVLEAFTQFNASEPAYITRFFDIKNTLDAFIKQYDVKSSSDIGRAIRSESYDFDITLLEPELKYLSFSVVTPDVERLMKVLNGVRFRDRGWLIYRFLYQYFSRGNSDFYNNLSAALLLDWMKLEYVNCRNIGSERLDFIASMINNYRKSLEFEDGFSVFTDDAADGMADKSDLLRIIMGMPLPNQEKSEK